MWKKRCCGHEGDGSWEERVLEICTGKLKSATIKKKRGDRIQAGEIGAQCLDVLDMLMKD